MNRQIPSEKFAWWNLFNFAHHDANRSSDPRWPKRYVDYETKRQRILAAFQEVFGNAFPELLAVCEITREAASDLATLLPAFENLLRNAISQAKENAPRALDDLLRCSSNAAEAVSRVTGGAAVLELVPINQGDNAKPTFQLQLRKAGSESPPSDLGIYSLTAAGYPIQRWYSRNTWESNPNEPAKKYPNLGELENHFRWMVSAPESRLVVLVTFFKQQEWRPAG